MKKINCGLTATIYSDWSVQHPMFSLCNFLEVSRLKVKDGSTSFFACLKKSIFVVLFFFNFLCAKNKFLIVLNLNLLANTFD